MLVEIDEKSGFCFGVVRAIEMAEATLANEGSAVSLGDIVHNGAEVQRLENIGLSTIAGVKHLGDCQGQTIIIRAHGEPPSTYREIERLGMKLVDATCPVVAKLQQRVREAHKKMTGSGGTVLILGKKGHAEVIGLTGQIHEQAIIVEKTQDLDQVDFSKPIIFLSQTTQSLELFEQVKNTIISRAIDPRMVEIHDTICRRVSSRAPHLMDFARGYDVILFVSGRKSSNGKALFEVCRASNPSSYLIESVMNINPEWLHGAQSVGICGATSTPRWQMQAVKDFLLR